MIYERLLRPILFKLDPETAHHLVLLCLRGAGPILPKPAETSEHPLTLFGMHFRHRLGLAAGLDKNGIALAAWEALGFAFAEIGTITAQPQKGNPRPRVFRFPEQRALINRLGFNNDGAEVVGKRLLKLRDQGRWPSIPIGINIGRSRAVPPERAIEDYLFSLQTLRDSADYIVLNVSSPNTPGLRELQQPGNLDELLRALSPECGGRSLLVKIAPDLDIVALDELIAVCENNNVAGIIATNTTLDHTTISGNVEGGLSGEPLREKSTRIVAHVARQTKIPVIGCGGILDQASAREKIKAGAKLLQLYTGFIYRGPSIIREIAAIDTT